MVYDNNVNACSVNNVLWVTMVSKEISHLLAFYLKIRCRCDIGIETDCEGWNSYKEWDARMHS